MKFRKIVSAFAVLAAAVSMPVVAQTDSTSKPEPVTPAAPRMIDAGNPARAELATRPWEYGPFFQGGKGIGYLISDYNLYSAGMRLGKVLTDPLLGGIFRGQFEYAGEIMPYWQAFTPPPHRQLLTYHDPSTGLIYSYYAPYGGGTYTGFSLTPIILRWDFQPHHKVAPWFQGAGGLIYTTHKFPPEVLVPHGTPGGTSVWNFSPQAGVGLQYFISPQRSIMFSANGIHISNASLGDRNPGVNASVQFQIGYTWWSRKP